MLRAVIAIQDKKLTDAFASLLKARAAAGSDREFSVAISVAMIGVAGSMTAEERAGLAEEIQATFLQSRQTFGVLGAQLLAAQARKLGLEELAKRIEPVVPPTVRGGKSAIAAAAIAGAPTISSSSGGSSDKVAKLVADKKFEAAAREALQVIRALNNQNGASYYQYKLREVMERLGEEGQAEMLKLVDPGESKSLVKRLEYADMCSATGKGSQALGVLEALGKERPDDAGIAARLAFTVPADQVERQLGLMTQACKEEQFGTQATAIASGLLEGNDGKRVMEFFETVTRWLEATDPKVLTDVNLTWASYHAKDFFGGDSDLGLPSLLSKDESSDRKGDKALVESYTALCGRLARALMRHASCAEEGFRLLAGTKAWKLEPAEMDECARQALLAAATPASAAANQWMCNSSQFFTLVQGNGSSTSGEDLSESSSASWLVTRLGEVKNPAEILTPAFIVDLTQRNPKFGEMLVSLNRELKNEDLAGLWDSEAMKSNSDRFSRMLRPLVLKRMATAPGASKFFVDKIAAIKPGEAVGRNGSVENHISPLFLAAITATATGKSGELDAVARAISKAVFGEKVEFSAATGQRDYQRVSLMDNLTDEFDHDALLMVRYQAAFFRLGVPVSQGDSGATEPFQNKRFTKAEEAEAFIESLGWLADADRWEPYASVVYDTDHSGNSMNVRVKPVLLMDRVFRYMTNGTTKRDDLIARLKERKKGRFGSLLAAAALSSGKDRSALAGQAFTESAAALAKLPPERIESFAMLLPWLPDEVRAKLPESFRRKLLGVESKKREEAIAAADKFIASLKSRGNNNNDGGRDVVAGLIPYDLDKAVEVFVADEQAYTDSLSRGGTYSNSSSNDWEYSQRDYSLYQLVQNDGVVAAFQANPDLRLKFYKKLLASPSGKRLSWTVYYQSQNLFSTAFKPLMKSKSFASETGDVVEMVETYQALEPELKAVGLPCFVLTKLPTTPIEDPKLRQAILTKLAKLVAKDPLAAKLATVRMAQWSWKACTPEEKTAARTAVTALFSDETIPDMARVMIAAELLTSLPKEDILDAAACTALTKLYQDYCAGERTAITQVSDEFFKTLVKTPLRDEAAVALYKALAQAFWANTALPKAAGHPPVPASIAQSTFIAAVLGDDSELIKSTFPRIKPLLAGKLSPMLALVRLGRVDLAKQLAPIPAAGFEIESNSGQSYDKALEESLAALKESGIEAPTLQKLEFELLDLPLGKKDDAPVETAEARTKRLVASYLATAPHESVVTTALRSLLRKAPATSALLAVADAWVKAHPVGDFLGRENNGNSRASSRAREAAIDLHGDSAIRAFAAGDTSRLKLLQEAVSAPPNNRNGGYQMSRDVSSLVRQISRTIWSGVCLGSTAGYKDGLAAWNDFAIQCATPISYDSSEISGVLAVSHFLASWSGDPAAFDKMCERLPEKTADYHKKFKRNDGFAAFVKMQNLDALPASISRSVFIEIALAQAGLASACSKTIAWVESLGSQGLGETISDLMANPPASLQPELLPALHGYRARFLREKNPAEALASCRKAIEICPVDAANNHLRGTLKRALADLLSAAKQVDEAKKTLASLTPEEIPDDMRASYLELAKKLEVKPVVSPLPPKKPEPSKK